MYSPSDHPADTAQPSLARTERSQTAPPIECEGEATPDHPSPTNGEGRRWPAEPDRVYELLREDLTTGLVPPGAPLVEASLAERYSTSRTPVRTALSRLVTDRLVEAKPHSVTRARDITAREVRQIYEIRQALEGFAAEVAATTIKRSTLERLLESFEAGPVAAGSDNPSNQAGVPALHFLIAESLGNGRLTDMLCAESLPLLRVHALYWRLAHSKVDAMAIRRRATAAEEHKAIAEALLIGSGSEARALLVDHLSAAADHIIALMTSVDLSNRSSFGAEVGSSDRAANALDHMLPGLPATHRDSNL